MIIVSSTSPIVSLVAVNALHLLRDLYGTILVPTAVEEEIRLGAGCAHE
jgi:predicted nucleic acid-binding protein